MLAPSHALAGVLYISPLTVNGAQRLKSFTITLYQTLSLKQLYLMMFETRHVASVGVSSHFGVASFLVPGRQTLLLINVLSFHLTPVGDLKGKDLPLLFIPFVSTHLLLL